MVVWGVQGRKQRLKVSVGVVGGVRQLVLKMVGSAGGQGKQWKLVQRWRELGEGGQWKQDLTAPRLKVERLV